MFMLRTALLCAALSLASMAAQAQNSFDTPGGARAAGEVAMCPKTGSSPVVYVPCDATNPMPGSAIPAGSNVIGTVNESSQYPLGATAITASATGTTGATTATLAGAANKTTYICSLSIRSNATAAATGNATVTGTITGTLNFTHWTAPLASGIGITEMIFNPCVPASAVNTGIAIISPAPGAGGIVSSTGTGYQL